MAEFDGNKTNAIVRSFMCGSDLSGSMQGAGEVGGLLLINGSTSAASHFVTYDGNGNVAATVSGSAGTTTATYEYGPFRELIRSSGTISKTNPYRFSTKYQDNETDLLYNCYRYYSHSAGRWVNRHIIWEAGGLNLYGLVGNGGPGKNDWFAFVRSWTDLGKTTHGNPVWDPEVKYSTTGLQKGTP